MGVVKVYVEVHAHLHAFVTSAIDGSQCPASRPAAVPLAAIKKGAGWTPEPVWSFGKPKNLSPLPEIETRLLGVPARTAVTAIPVAAYDSSVGTSLPSI